MFSEKVASVLYCYGVYQDRYNQMMIDIPNIRFHEGVPSLETLQEMRDGHFHVVVLDDLMESVVSDVNIQKLFTQHCHHYHFTVILVYQNVYVQGKYARSIAVNTHISVHFENKRDVRQIRTFASQLYPKNPKAFIEAYEDATRLPYGYLVVDCSPGTSKEVSWRSNIFPDQYTIVYAPK